MLAGFRAELAKRDEEALARAERMMAGLQEQLARREEQLGERLAMMEAGQAGALQRLEQSILQQISGKFSCLLLAVAGHVSSAVRAAVAAGLALKRAQSRRSTANAAAMPEAQRATSQHAGPLALGLSTVGP